MSRTETALIVGAGKGLSASLARLFAAEGMQVALAARDSSKLTDLVGETGALALNCDASRPDDVKALFDRVEDAFGAPDLVVYNASGRYRAESDRVRWLSRSTGRSRSNAGTRQWHHSPDRCHCQRQRATWLGAICDGQVRPAGNGSMHGARARPEKYSRCTLRYRRWHRE